jgi:hypothetical protein
MSAEKLRSILDKERSSELIPFLKSLSKEEKKELGSTLKKIHKEYTEFKEFTSLLGGTTYKQKASPDQVKLLSVAAFCILPRKDYEKIDSFNYFLSYKNLQDVLSWYCPDWFNDSINSLAKREWLPWELKYDFVMNLWEKGYLQPVDELVVRLIPEIIFERDANHKHLFIPQNLEKHTITLEKHIWLIFQYETTIHFSDRYMQFGNEVKKEDFKWLRTLKYYSEKGLITRQRILKESILASSRNFNKNLSGWFIDLFLFFEPTESEIISLQPDLFIALNSQHSKIVNTILSSLKKIVDSKEFSTDNFLEYVAILLTSETKSVVSSALQLLEKVLKNDANRSEEICVAVCQAFIHADESIQNKIVKLLQKYNTGSEAVINELSKYSDSMLMSSRKALDDLLIASPSEKRLAEDTSIKDILIKYDAINEIRALDEVIFLASQAFDNNDPMHIDLLPAALVKFQEEITGEVLPKFEPALQRAYRMIMNDWPSTMGYLDHLLATFFIDVTKFWIVKYPSNGTSLSELHDTYKKKDDESRIRWNWYTTRILQLETWSMHTKDTTYVPHKSILYNAYLKIKNKELLPILSTPTHTCGFIDPLVLVERLAKHQSASALPDNFDFQIAISRIAPFHHEEAIKEAKNVISGEVLHLLNFLLTPNEKPFGPFTTSVLWFMAGVTKDSTKTYPEFRNLTYSKLPKAIFTGDVPWKSFLEKYMTSQYNYQKRKSEQVEAQHKILRLTINSSSHSNNKHEANEIGFLNRISKWVSLRKSESEKEEVQCIYEFLTLKGQFPSAEYNDIQRFIYLFPSNPNPLLALITSKALVHSTLSSESDKKALIKTLESLVPLNFKVTEITHVFIATCLLVSDKTVRSFAAELWINSVKYKTINSEQIGTIIGIHLGIGYAPIKRFTDIISDNMIQISKAHNIELEIALVQTLVKLPDAPPVGLKKLLELYSEVLSSNQSSVDSIPLKQKLTTWENSSNLKKLITSLKN